MGRSPFPDPRVDQPSDLPSAAVGLWLPGRVGAGVCRFGCAAAAHGGQQGEERADSQSFLSAVPELAVWVHGVAGATPARLRVR